MSTFYAGQKNYIAELNNLAAIAGLSSFEFTLDNDATIKWIDSLAVSPATELDCLKLDASNNFNVGVQSAPSSGGALALWAAAAEKVRILATGALLVGATAAIAGETVLANVAAITPVSNTVVGVLANGAGQATATTSIRGFESRVTTAASAFTATELSHFKVTGAAAGAGSAITSLYGVKVDNAAAVGTNNYAFWTDFASASNKYAIYASGTAWSYFGGNLGVRSPPGNDIGINIGTPGGTGATFHVVYLGVTGPTTASTAVRGYFSTLASTASAYTLSEVVHFYASSTTKGAGSTITSAYGFIAGNSIASASNNYGFWSNIASASSTYQLYMGGTATSYIAGGLAISSGTVLTASTTTLLVGRLAAQTGTAANMVYVNSSAPSTATAAWRGVSVSLLTDNSAFTLTSMIGFHASSFSKGAASTITNSIAFYATNTIVVATNNYGFYSNIASAATTYQLYMGGTALNFMKGGLILDTTAAPTVGAGQVGLGATVQTTVGAAGGASALPATPTGYLIINVAGTNRVVPYFAAS